MELRAYERTDDEALDRVWRAARAVDGDVSLPGPGDLGASGLVAVADGDVVGYSRLDRWTEADGTEMFLVTGCVDPAHRGRGHGTALLRRQEAQAVAIGGATPQAMLGGNADEGHADAQELLRDNGYQVAFTLVRLRRPVTAVPIPPLPDGLRLRPVRAEHHPAIHAAIDECFTGDRLGFVTVDYDEYLAGVSDTDLWVVAWDGDEVAGLVVNEREDDGVVDSPWVAVRPAYRRRGLASALLARSLASMREHGVTTACLRTVAENPHGTVSLYERAGYQVVQRLPRFRKPLHP
ncbi:GNAT family N-acetyltransferase [Catellatospora sp. NPDC049609]|uniref:GNAT family N-acetyltransferase n=1 Tax=Catellatospora sp. NPDC049609 TaxID=3155505 RepID=UPI0034233760